MTVCQLYLFPFFPTSTSTFNLLTSWLFRVSLGNSLRWILFIWLFCSNLWIYLLTRRFSTFAFIGITSISKLSSAFCFLMIIPYLLFSFIAFCWMIWAFSYFSSICCKVLHFFCLFCSKHNQCSSSTSLPFSKQFKDLRSYSIISFSWFCFFVSILGVLVLLNYNFFYCESFLIGVVFAEGILYSLGGPRE